jgi:antitoxin ParD1/3/4
MGSMTSLNISLPQSLEEYVGDQVQNGGFRTPSEYFGSLLLDDQKRKSEARLEALLLQGLNSGPPVEITPEYWERKQQDFMTRLAATTNKTE